MKTKWMAGFKGTKQQVSDRRQTILTAKGAFHILTGMLTEEIASLDQSRCETHYDLPNYAAYQADCSGYIRALRKVISLINVDDERSSRETPDVR